MEWQGWVFLSMLLLFVICSLWAAWHQEREQLRAFTEEKTKPRYAVWFVTHDGKMLKSKTIEPTKHWTSEKLAKMYMEDYFHKTYFTCEQGISYPVRNIKKAWVGEVKNDGQN